MLVDGAFKVACGSRVLEQIVGDGFFKLAVLDLVDELGDLGTIASASAVLDFHEHLASFDNLFVLRTRCVLHVGISAL